MPRAFYMLNTESPYAAHIRMKLKIPDVLKKPSVLTIRACIKQRYSYEP